MIAPLNFWLSKTDTLLARKWTANMNQFTENEDQESLGSLGQAARGNQLKSARWIMIFVGVVNIALNAFLYTNVDSQIDAEVAELRQQGLVADPAVVEEARSESKLLAGGGVAVGVVFVFLGISVYVFPVPCTVLGLVLYIGLIALAAVLDPTQIARGIIIKIVIIVAMVKSIGSAVAYQKEKQQADMNGTNAWANPD